MNVSRRIASLERAFDEIEGSHRSGPGRDHAEFRAFVRGVLRAIVHIRREPIDSPPWKYRTSMLHNFEPFTLGQYVVALSVTEHPDEAEARRLLKSTDEGLVHLADSVVRRIMGASASGT